MTQLVLAVGALFAGLVLPGVAVGVLAERRSEPPTRLRFVIFAMTGGFTVWYLGSELLVRANGLYTPVVWMLTVAVAVASTVIIRQYGGEVFTAMDWRAGVPSIVVGGIATMVASFSVLELLSERRDSFIASTPWYYWRLVQETVAARGVPTWSYEWADRLPFLDDYPGFTSATAVLAVASGDARDLIAAHLVTAVAVVSLSAATYVLARAVGADRLPAAMATVMMTAGGTVTGKIISFRPEAVGYALMLLVPAVAVDYCRRRRGDSLLLAAVASLVLSQVHALDWVFMVALTGGAVVAFGLLREDRRPGTVRAVFLFGVVVGGAWIAGSWLLGTGLSGAGKLGGLPEIVDGVDPTHVFRRYVLGTTLLDDMPSLQSLITDSLTPDLLGGSELWWTIGAIVTFAALGYASTQRGEPRRKAFPMVILVVVAFLVVLVFSTWLAVTHSTFVPRRTGFSRVLQMSFFLFPLGLAVLLSIVGQKQRVLAGVVAVAVAGAAFVPSLAPMHEAIERMPARSTLTELRALDLPDDAVVLTNFYSEGFVPNVLDARGVLDGRAPYTEAQTLAKVNALLLRSLEFFAVPLQRDLPLEGITHVLVADGPDWSLGAGKRFATDIGALDVRPDLKLVASGKEYRLYEVVDPSAGTDAGDR